MSKVILITGASTGIGAATARLLAPQNKIIVHYYSSKEAAEKVAKDVEENGGEAFLVQEDLTSEEACIRLVKKAANKYSKLDILINNAGGLIRRQAAHELEWKLMIETFSLNTFSTMKLSSLCIPLLKKGEDPNIVNISSIAMRNGAPSAVIYGACKGAVDSFTRGLAKELAPEIRVNAVAPGVIDTPFHEKVSTPEKMMEFKKSIGETIDVNGGLFMR